MLHDDPEHGGQRKKSISAAATARTENITPTTNNHADMSAHNIRAVRQ